jgi:hypothetical protein
VSSASQYGASVGRGGHEAQPFALRIPLTIHRYLPLASFYFFFNRAGLPVGLFYTTIFAPAIFVWLYLKGIRFLTARFLIILAPFIVAHIILGISSSFYYARSLLLLWTVYIAVYGICLAMTRTSSLAELFEQLIVVNFGATLLALVLFPTPLRSMLWQNDRDVLVGVSNSLRLNLLNTEPSAYALLMLPLLLFATLRLLRGFTIRGVWWVVMIALPFLLCQSFGGISMFAGALAVVLLINYKRLFLRRSALVGVIATVAAFSLILLTPNPISQRIVQVISGGDSSTSSRTIYSFWVAFSVASSKSLWWGAGLGQGKLVDVSNLGVGFDIGTIPNAVAGTFAELGIIGVLVRFAAEIFLFFRTRVYRNSFRTAMFTVAFVTQLTGSYLTDVQEYVIWFLAFWQLFPEFNSDAAHSRNGKSLQVSRPTELKV